MCDTKKELEALEMTQTGSQLTSWERCASCRILQNLICYAHDTEAAHLAGSEQNHVLYKSLRTGQSLNWIRPWFQYVWSNISAQIPTGISCDIQDVEPGWSGGLPMQECHVHLRADIRVSLSHTSIIWPWSGTPKGTFVWYICKWLTSGLIPIAKVPFTCVCRTLHGPLVLLPNLQGFHFLLNYPLLRDSHIDNAFDFLLCDFHLFNVLVFVPISNQRNIEERVLVEWKTSGATSQGRMYCCSHGMHSNGWSFSFIDVFFGVAMRI